MIISFPINGAGGGHAVLVDENDLALVDRWNWYAEITASGNVYARAMIRVEGKRTGIRMHRVLLPNARLVDHRDGDGLNNTRKNLRPANHSQNLKNSKKRHGMTSRYKGVSWSQESEAWTTRATVNGKPKYLGNFSSEVDAAKAVDAVMKREYGEFARLNFPDKSV